MAGSLCGGQTALIAAVIAHSPIAVQSLLAAAADVNLETTASGQTALIAAAESGNEYIVEQLVNAKANVNLETRAGGTAMLHAVVACRHDLVGLLAELKADPNHQHRNGCVSLVEAAAIGNVTVVAALVAAGADVTKAGTSARLGSTPSTDITPLEAAARQGQTAVIHALCATGSVVSSAMQLSQIAAQAGHTEASSALQKYEQEQEEQQ